MNLHSVPVLLCLTVHACTLYIMVLVSSTGSYNGRSKPVYHSLLSDSSSGSCTDYCQLTSSSSLALQLTTPMTPPTTSSLRNFQQYIDGTLRDSTFDDVSLERY